MSTTTPEKSAEAVMRQASTVRNNILNYMPLDTEGIDLNRLNKYREEMQSSETPLLFLSPSNFRIASLAMRKNFEHDNGAYDEEHDLALVRRSLAHEALNGTALLESFGIHEVAHGTHLPYKAQFRYGPLPSDRLTISHRDLQHSPWEEGYAEFERGLYVQKHGLEEQFTAGAPDYASKKDGLVPSHYLYRDPNLRGNLNHTPAAPAAAIFELLTQQDDTLLPLIRKSRHEYISGAIELAKTVDEMMPGLRHALLYASYDETPDILEQVYKRFGKNHIRKNSITIDL